jgi:hypothetical protein
MTTKLDAVRFAALLTVTVAFASGCLATFVPDSAPADPAPAGGTGSNGGTMSGGGVGSGGGTSSNGADGGTMPAGDGGGAATDAAPPAGDLGVACDTVQSTAGLVSPSGHHNAGQECQGCHAPGNGAPTFYVGGTLYNAATGGAAVGGATINVTDANGKKVKIISATNGNFWTSTALVYPITVNASLCPSTLPMSATVSGNGACNNCHNSTFRVHLP